MASIADQSHSRARVGTGIKVADGPIKWLGVETKYVDVTIQVGGASRFRGLRSER